MDEISFQDSGKLVDHLRAAQNSPRDDSLELPFREAESVSCRRVNHSIADSRGTVPGQTDSATIAGETEAS